MITMLDSNGDGQVGLTEFHSMVRSPDPSKDNLSREILTNKIDESSFLSKQRKEDIEARGIKRRSVSRFMEINAITKTNILEGWKLIEKKWVQELNRRLNFETFCTIFCVDPTNENHKCFKLFDTDSSGTIDGRVIVLALLNFISLTDMSRLEKCKLIFDMFDEDRSGFLELNELEDILAANHMMSRQSVLSKAKTIFKTIDEDGSGSISLKELHSVAHKFPNLLLPRHSP